MNTAVENEIIADLRSIADSDYQQFQAKLVPNINANLVLGVRTPALRRYAKPVSYTHLDVYKRQIYK